MMETTNLQAQQKNKHHLLDHYTDSTYKAYHNVPLQRNLRVVWTVISFLILLVWTNVYIKLSMDRKFCYVEENSDGTYTLVSRHLTPSQANQSNVVDVSA